MRVNIYAEEMTDRIEIISKEIDGHQFTGLRFYLELPATVGGVQHQAPFIHRPGDDDSSAVTFWGKRDLREQLRHALSLLDEHYGTHTAPLTAEADNAALRQDAERLDWLAEHPREATIRIGTEMHACVFYGVSCDPKWTAREAIDAAMREGKE